jgi:hypothetical protein
MTYFFLCALAGCRLGDVSKLVVPRGAFMRIPVSSGSKNCLKVCQCSAKGSAENCVQLPCYSLDACLLGSHKFSKAYFYAFFNKIKIINLFRSWWFFLHGVQPVQLFCGRDHLQQAPLRAPVYHRPANFVKSPMQLPAVAHASLRPQWKYLSVSLPCQVSHYSDALHLAQVVYFTWVPVILCNTFLVLWHLELEWTIYMCKIAFGITQEPKKKIHIICQKLLEMHKIMSEK